MIPAFLIDIPSRKKRKASTVNKIQVVQKPFDYRA
jgi:hypothetical protein